jgi:GNAT superfamily N-acetyltransferase
MSRYAVRVEANPFVVVGGLVVDKSSRRRGIGQMLMEYAETWAKEQRCSIVRLWSSAGRTGAHQFYERQGGLPEHQNAVLIREAAGSEWGAGT